MCGIAGLFAPNLNPEERRHKITTINEALHHRGPDDEGYEHFQDAPLSLAHKRLSIIDLSESGRQPMESTSGRYTIVFNGEIYNYRELRKELEKQGASFRTGTDTEVILELYAREGEKAFRRLRGMWALAIWDREDQELILCRDPMGIKPLYLWQDGGQLAFASEIRALIRSGLFSPTPSAQGIYHYLLYGYFIDPLTGIEEVTSLPAGTMLRWKDNRAKKKQYWSFKEISERRTGSYPSYTMDKEEQYEYIRDQLKSSIQSHMVSDVPVGVFLSGGLDSTTILALMREFHDGDIQSYSIGFPEAESDEGELAREVADQYHTTHHEWGLDSRVGSELFHEFLSMADVPSVDGFNTWCVSRFAHENGAKVVLSGLGGDELFAGYPAFDKIPVMLKTRNLMRAIPGADYLVGNGLHAFAQDPRLKRIGDFLSGQRRVDQAHRCFRAIFTRHEAARLVQRFGIDNPEEYHLPHFEFGRNLSRLERIGMLEMNSYMRGQLLRDSDVTSMSHSLELRVPFVDRFMMENLYRETSSEVRLQSGKQLIRDVMKNDLPSSILEKPKAGFMFPFREWVKKDWAPIFESTVAMSSKSVPLKTWERLYTVFMLKNWFSSVCQIELE